MSHKERSSMTQGRSCVPQPRPNTAKNKTNKIERKEGFMSSFWLLGISAIFLGHLGHLVFDFWASLCSLLYLKYDCQLVRFWFGLVTLVWVCRHLVLTAGAKMGSISSKAPPWVGAPWEILNDWSTYIYDAMTKKYGLKIGLSQFDLHCHRMRKWSRVPACPGLSPIVQKPDPPQRDDPCWDILSANVPLLSGQIWALPGLNFRYDHRQRKVIFWPCGHNIL